MKRYLSIQFVLLFMIMNISAQQLSNENFIYNEIPQKPVKVDNYGTLSQDDIIKNISYFDGLGRLKQTIGIGQGVANNLLQWKTNWILGSGGTSSFNANGQASENIRIDGVNPFGKTDRLWRCVNDAASDADGGWNTTDIAIDKTKSYVYAVWVKRTGGQNGTTYHGTQNVVNLDGSPNGNPYFWYGNLPQLNTWYLMVGKIHESTYTGGYSGISGVYDMSGHKVISGTDFKWSSYTINTYFRSYLYYATDENVSQFFYAPVVQKIEGSQTSVLGLIKGIEAADIVTPTEYDDFGRQEKEYLPYATSSAGGQIIPNALTGVLNYYNTTEYENTANPFSKKEFEVSPLDRIIKQAAPGNAWTLGSGHEIKFDYQTNTASEVKLFTVSLTFANNTFTPTLGISSLNSGYFEARELYKTITYDENWVSGKNNSTEEFKDKEGRVVLKRTYANYDTNNDGDTLDSGEQEIAHDTYYVYDNYGNLTYVLPPKMDATTTAIATINSQLSDLGYQYKYDNRNRLVEKKLPGKDWEFIVYDKLDRPILTQDANLRNANKWLFTKYDAFSRPAYTGEYINTAQTTRATVQTLADGSSNLYESRQTTALNINNSAVNYSNVAFPNTDINLFTINYYDNYDNIDLDGGVSAESYGITPITNVKGLNTCSKVRVLDTNDWITSVVYYDNKSRPIYNYSKNNYLQVTNYSKSKLDFSGKIVETTNIHERVNYTTITRIDTFTYDHMGRLLTQKQKINNQAEEFIVSNQYDNLGLLISKGIGGKATQSRLQNVDFSYNVRGWLKAINDVNNIGNDLFSFKIHYNNPSDVNKSLYNGNISQTYWKTANTDTSLRNYLYTYDNLNRLTSAVDNTNNYNESLSYDKNGNIMTLLRMGNIDANATQFGTMDDLVYNYDSGNKLIKVEDLATSIEGFKDVSNVPIEYTYDNNGNLKTDSHKTNLRNIFYNHLNLPKSMDFGTGNISYVYDALGTKLQKKTPGTLGPIVTDYAGEFQYKSNVLQFIQQPEGYIANNNGIFDYIYQYKDHLGNVRLSYGDADNNGIITNAEIVEENNYYPFGLTHKGYNTASTSTNTALKYRFNGKEFQDENIRISRLNWYDYGARNYDPALGRWMNIDPLAEKYDNYSPYVYTVNNPVFFTDPDGMRLRWATWRDIQKDDELKTQFSTRKEYRQARRELRKQYNETLKNSETASKIYMDLDEDSATHTIYAQKTTGGDTKKTESGGTKIKIGIGNGSTDFLDGISSNESNIQAQIGHEGGHAWAKMNGVESELKSLDRQTANSFDVTLYNNSLEKRERFASHVENMVRAELIANGTQNMSLSSQYFSRKAVYTGGSFSKVEYQTTTYKILENNPYNAQGYLSRTYNLPVTKR